MKRKGLLIYIFVFIILSTFSAYGQGSTLELWVDEDEILLGESLEVHVKLKSPSNIAGGEIILEYDGDIFQVLNKEFNLKEDTFINLQEYGESLKDYTGAARLIFGLLKDRELLNQDITIGKIILKAKDLGTSMLSIEKSRLVREDGQAYIYDNTNVASPIQVKVYKLGSIRGKIALDEGDIPVKSRIYLLRNGEVISSAILSYEGSYIFEGLEDGNYTVRINIPGYIMEEAAVTIISYNDEEVNFTLTRIKEDVGWKKFILVMQEQSAFDC